MLKGNRFNLDLYGSSFFIIYTSKIQKTINISYCKLKALPLIDYCLHFDIISVLSILADKGLQICWTPQKDIQTHFVEVVFSNQGKSNGGPIRTHQIYQHLGIAQIFYQNSDSKSKQKELY